MWIVNCLKWKINGQLRTWLNSCPSSKDLGNFILAKSGRFLTDWAMREAHINNKKEIKLKIIDTAQHSEKEDHGIWSHHFMGNRWGNSRNSVRLYFLGGSKITADGDCSHEMKRRLLLGRKVMTNLDSIFKNRAITVPTKVRLVKAMVFPLVTYGCEIWTLWA